MYKGSKIICTICPDTGQFVKRNKLQILNSSKQVYITNCNTKTIKLFIFKILGG
jgi:hypothetical protein